MSLKIFLIFSFVFCFFIQDSEIIWQEQNVLVWENFKGKPNKTSPAAAVTASGIAYNLSVSKVDERIVDFDATVITHFYPEKSWCKKDLINPHILLHEQFHFNITELHSRMLRKQFSLLKANPDLVNQLQKLYKNINLELQEFQDLYDSETDFSRNYEAQKKWELSVLEKLKDLKAFQL